MLDRQQHPGLFLALEGTHGSGKTTQAKRLTDWLTEQGHQVQATREVGGTLLGERIRELIQDSQYVPSLQVAPKALLFLVLAARNLHVQQVIRPALSEGKIVICERFEGSTYAMQCFGDQLEWDLVQSMHSFAAVNLAPDLTILLDVPAQLGIARKNCQGIQGFWDTRPIEYHERIVRGYRDAARRLENWIEIDATRDVDSVFAAIQQRVAPLLRNP